mmetsp:Transcript_10411/g.19416  ORF Transcript_10411/g.19416 Transcript_10411/m.19416 type:complete len:1435 (-) Transcript_10411:835-5139(-)
MSDVGEWNSLVVLVEGAVNRVSGRKSNQAERAKTSLFLSAQADLETNDSSLYTVVSREELISRAGEEDEKKMADALKEWIRKDRIKGLARINRSVENDQSSDSTSNIDVTQNHIPETDEVDDEEHAKEAKDRKESMAQFALVEASCRVKAIERELSHDSTCRLEPTPEDLSIARNILNLSETQGLAHKIYLLNGYPATKKEASFLVSSSGTDGALDVVVELVGGPCDEIFKPPSRTTSQATEGAKSMVVVSDTSKVEDNSASAVTLPSLNMLSQSDSVATLGTASVISVDGTESRCSRSHEFTADPVGDARSVLVGCKNTLKGAMQKPLMAGETVHENDIVGALRAARTAAKGPGWNDMVFLKLPVAQQNEKDDPTEYLPLKILSRFSNLMKSTAVEKYRFKQYVKQCEHVHIGSHTVEPEGTLCEIYSSFCDEYSETALQSVPLILSCVTGAVDIYAGLDEQTGKRGNFIEEQVSAYVKNCKPKVNEIPSIIHWGDESLLRCTSLGDDDSSSLVLSLERKLWGGVEIPGGVERRCMPRFPELNPTERGLHAAQFATFTELSPERIEYINAVVGFEELMQTKNPPFNFGDRVFKRHLPKHIVSQILGNALSQDPHTSQLYLPREDKLLLALYQTVPVGRRQTVTRSAFCHTSLRPTFSEWPFIDLRERPCIYDVDANTLVAIEQRVEMLYPCDDGIIRLESLSLPQDEDGAETQNTISYCSVDKDDQRFGMRKSHSSESKASFVASFDDGSSLEIRRGEPCEGKPDKFGTMKSLHTCANGLHVSHSSNGCIRMSSLEEEDEIERVILPGGEGTVVCFLDDDRVRVLYANGSVSEYDPVEDSWQDTCFGKDKSEKYGFTVVRTKIQTKEETVVVPIGRKSSRMPVSEVKPETPPSKFPEPGKYEVSSASKTLISMFEDSATGALIKEFAGVTLVQYTDGKHVVNHAGGTSYIFQENKLRVEAPGFATVKIATDSEQAAAKHSRGGRVAISRGGKVTRSSTLFPDATVVHVNYDTRVTAAINGEIRIEKCDGVVIIAADDGTVCWRSWDLERQQREQRRQIEEEEDKKELHAEAREQSNTNLGCYIFNCDTADFKLMDWEANTFHVNNLTSFTDREIVVDLSAKFEEIDAVVNKPLQPRLFEMFGDGTGCEYLSKKMMEDTRRRFEKRFRSKFRSAQVEQVAASNNNSESKRRTRKKQQNKDIPQEIEKCCPTVKCDIMDVSLGLEQLSIVETSKPPSLREIAVSGTFQGRSHITSRASKPNQVVVLDTVHEYQVVTDDDRKSLINSENMHTQWKHNGVLTEDQYNVSDNRPTEAMKEESRLQSFMLKERAKLRRAEKKRLKKLQQASTPSPRSNGDSTRSFKGSVKESFKGSFRGGATSPAMSSQHSDDPIDGALEMLNEDDHPNPSEPERPDCPSARNSPLTTGMNFWDDLQTS